MTASPNMLMSVTLQGLVQRACVNVISIDWLTLFVLFHFSPFPSQFTSPYPLFQTEAHMASPFSPASLPSAYRTTNHPVCSSYYTPSHQLPSLPLTPYAALPSVPSSLGTPQTPLSTPQYMAFPGPLHAMARSSAVPHQQRDLPTPQQNLGSFYTPHSTLPLSQVQTTPFPAPIPEQELADQPVQVNI